ncbi:MAG: 50S ribosomal protein L2 [Parcubacteria group bacterium GW2011_GWC1_40_13]|nr:MAG: 50S ribosomal protein L2 [Parcubacteria group bacterium GW2011_GWC1_40_13]
MKHYRPTTKSRRHMSTISYRKIITAKDPHKALTSGFKRSVGRNSFGRLTTPKEADTNGSIEMLILNMKSSMFPPKF